MTKKLKIAFLHKALVYGGAERLILDMALSAGKFGHESTFITAEYSEEKTFREFSEKEDIIKIKVSKKNSF